MRRAPVRAITGALLGAPRAETPEGDAIVPGRIIIDSRFHGPPTSGNGGYVCGLVAGFIGRSAMITLRRPPPLETPLVVDPGEGGQIRLLDGDAVVAVGQPVDLDLEVPDPPSVTEAEEASRSFAGFDTHMFPTCFVCGPERDPGDGLRVFPGRVGGRPLVAAPWTPDHSLADGDGWIRPEFLWAALDCPGVFGVVGEQEPRPTVLGQLTARIDGQIRPGSRCIVTAWGLGTDGRKLYAGTALFTDTGKRLGMAQATWIELTR